VCGAARSPPDVMAAVRVRTSMPRNPVVRFQSRSGPGVTNVQVMGSDDAPPTGGGDDGL
jgi:hypothetical protein